MRRRSPVFCGCLGRPALLVVVLVTGAGRLSAAPVAAARSNSRCLECHSEQRYRPQAPDEARPSFIDVAEISTSIHGQYGVGCADCHPTAVTVPHTKEAVSYTCVDCHKDTARPYTASIHGRAREQAITEAATCTDCHGGHDIRAQTDPRSRTHPSQVDKTCLRCHTNDEMAERFQFTRQHIGADYEQSVHAQMIAAGHEEAATCNRCHGSHDVLPSRDPASKVNRKNIPQTCGACHWVVLGEFKRSIHGQKAAAGVAEAPVCNDCHRDHRVLTATSDRFKLAIVSQCGSCHADLLKSYRLGYHGKVTQLGGSGTARCSDCHGYHGILPASDPESRVAPDNRVATCKRCHPYANAKFARFLPHLEYSDKSHSQTYYPWLFMTWLLVGTIGFFLLHSVLWLARESVDVWRRRRAPVTAANDPPAVYVRRFERVHRVTHALLFVSVIGLVLTGMPLRYSEADWAHWVFGRLGGYRAAGRFHRFFGALTAVYVGIHFTFLWRLWRRGPRRPFWKTVFGPAMLPILAPILPGWVFNIALIVHSEEALLASSFLFLIRFFHVHLRPLKFPNGRRDHGNESGRQRIDVHRDAAG